MQALLGCEVRFQWGLGVPHGHLAETMAMWACWLVRLNLNNFKMPSDSPRPKTELSGRSERVGSRISKFAVWDLGQLGVKNSGRCHAKVNWRSRSSAWRVFWNWVGNLAK